MNILLTGASGFIGRNIAVALATAGHHVIAASRRTGVDFSRLLTPEDWQPHLVGVEAVINSVGIIGERGRQRFATLHTRAPSALFQACAQAGIRRLIQLSALGADETAFSAYHLSKRAADACLRSLDLDWFVLRPSLIYGRGGKSADLFMRMARLPAIPVIGTGQQKLQPVHISDVVATVMKALTSTESRKTLDILGPETIAFADWLQTMRRAQNLPRARLLPIPFPLAMVLAHVGRHINPMLTPDNLRMLQSGYWADFRPLAAFLGRTPLSAAPHLFFSDAITARSAS
ncbi:complex I NDUFA9 subunit family protein [Oryzomicrobium sp.]|uniref:complex I NDUFA9 subunit family protein n=1 Tax=Oryzomicrobium sp. TaxID=1911578 RepID=UPI002601335C|nr:complex I NDUFA9 subunit family protein [Oryzomicrobium sp.]MCE1243513.1 complex I NDUFA9 subunit family protein [Oryzomicrobium sp.]